MQMSPFRVRAGLGVLCNKLVPIKGKGKFYRTVVWPALLLGTDCLALKSQEYRMQVAEMRMLRYTSGVSRKNKLLMTQGGAA